MLTPRRRRGAEILDDPAVDAHTRERSLRDVSRSNVLFGGRRATLLALRELLGSTLPEQLVLLDVGCGLGDLSEAARSSLGSSGVRVTAIGLDEAASLARAAATDGRVVHAICGDALRLPLRDRSVDVALCSQLLHHFVEEEARVLLSELDRVARVGVVVSDLRRSWVAAAGFWLASWPLRFHAVTRHDGVLSVLRGFSQRELDALVRDARGPRAGGAKTHRRLGWRITSSWRTAA